MVHIFAHLAISLKYRQVGEIQHLDENFDLLTLNLASSVMTGNSLMLRSVSKGSSLSLTLAFPKTSSNNRLTWNTWRKGELYL